MHNVDNSDVYKLSYTKQTAKDIMDADKSIHNILFIKSLLFIVNRFC